MTEPSSGHTCPERPAGTPETLSVMAGANGAARV